MTSHILERVPLQQVRLLPGEHFDAQQAGARYLLDLDVDRLLYPFRREAGLPQPTDADGNPVTSYPNWEETGLDGHIAGHYLSACVGFAQVADDPQPFIDRAATVGRSHADGLVLCTKRCGYRRKENKVQLWIFNYGLFDQAMKLGFTSCRSWRCLRRSASAPRRRPPAAAVRRSGRLPSPHRTG